MNLYFDKFICLLPFGHDVI